MVAQWIDCLCNKQVVVGSILGDSPTFVCLFVFNSVLLKPTGKRE